MKRECRQHGSVRIYPILEAIPLSQQRYVKNNNMVDPANVIGMFPKVSGKPTKSLQWYVDNDNTVVPCYVFGMYNKVSGKPTNQSKFTGKCPEDHFYPYKGYKGKGTTKWRSLNECVPELVSCGAGASATRAFAYLAGQGSYDDHDEYEGEFDVYERNYI